MKAPHYGRDGLMALAAFRYCLGRQTYIVSDCAHWLIDQWASLPPNTRAVIERDLREEFKRDDEARADMAGADPTTWRHKPLGADCDRASWQAVLNVIDAHKVQS